MPRIAIPVPTSSDPAYNERSWPQYAAAVREAGGDPVQLNIADPLATVRAQALGCDGVLLPGSPADVEPTRFGVERDPATSPADPAREAMDFMLLDLAEQRGLPVLGICYGCQSMNVWRGGSLVQDLAPLPVNHSAGRQVAVAHAALIAPDSLLGTIVDRQEAPLTDGFLRLPMNTSHHQAVASPGAGLRIVARCPDDGVIEAIEGGAAGASTNAADGAQPGRFLLGVQWHPERTTAISATSRALFARLVAEASKRKSAAEAR